MRKSFVPTRVGNAWRAVARFFRRRKTYPFQGIDVCIKRSHHDLIELRMGGTFCRTCHQTDPMHLSKDSYQ